MTENEAIEELKYDCNEIGKAIPCSIPSCFSIIVCMMEQRIKQE